MGKIFSRGSSNSKKEVIFYNEFVETLNVHSDGDVLMTYEVEPPIKAYDDIGQLLSTPDRPVTKVNREVLRRGKKRSRLSVQPQRRPLRNIGDFTENVQETNTKIISDYVSVVCGGGPPAPSKEVPIPEEKDCDVLKEPME